MILKLPNPEELKFLSFPTSIQPIRFNTEVLWVPSQGLLSKSSPFCKPRKLLSLGLWPVFWKGQLYIFQRAKQQRKMHQWLKKEIEAHFYVCWKTNKHWISISLYIIFLVMMACIDLIDQNELLNGYISDSFLWVDVSYQAYGFNIRCTLYS